MLIVHCRVQPEGVTTSVDQRWRSVELDPEVFTGLDLTSAQGIAAAIRRINDGVVTGQVGTVDPFPHGSEVYLTNTDTADHWELRLTITKVPAP